MIANHLHTLRHLKPVQIYGRVRFHLHRPKIDHRAPPALRAVGGRWHPPIEKTSSMEGPSTFRFLNSTHAVKAPSGWADAQRDKLWLYNLHYFDDLNADAAVDRAAWHRSLIARWIAENAHGEGVGWEPYPLSRRIVNWIKWALAGNDLGDEARRSLAIQVRHLQKRIEWHLLGNHLLANAAALVFAGVYFGGPEADGWRTKGLDILERELPEQLLGDGGHFELSPMYHAVVLANLLDLVNLAGAYPGVVSSAIVDAWKSQAGSMRSWLAAMSHPDGQIAFFNDSAFGMAAAPDQLEAYARRLGLSDRKTVAAPVTHLEDSGYLRLSLGEMVAILDVGRVGPDYQPGHAHADTLSFELSLFGRRVLVNSGTSCYGVGPERCRQRATAAHNTLEVDGRDSSEVWAGFRVARRARPFDFHLTESDGTVHVACAHDGYRRLPGRAVHRRQWDFDGDSLRVTDRVEGRYQSAVARFHVHPDVAVEGDGPAGRLILPGGRPVAWHVEGATARVVPSRFHPEFGLSIANACIEAAATGPDQYP